METTKDVGPRTQERAAPEVNRIESLNKFFYLAGKVTAKSMADRRAGIERSLQLRRSRAELYKKFRKTDKADEETRRELVREGKIRDDLERQYLNQGEVTVDMPGLGKQTARYTIINPPETAINPQEEPKPPIYFIPGISNDLDCVKSTLQELAYSGRKVVGVAFPESFMGTITPEFAQAVQTSPDLEPHVEFFKRAEAQLIGEDAGVELWGHSTGAAIIEQVLNDPKFQEKTARAVLLCPSSSVNISQAGLSLGMVKEVSYLLGRFGNLARYSFTQGAKEGQEKSQKDPKKQVFKKLMELARTKLDLIEGAKVKTGGRIVVISGNKDELTKSREARDEFKANPQVDFIELPDGHHATPITNPAMVINMVNQQ